MGDGEGQGSLACCHTWGHKESDMIEQLNNNKKEALIKAYKLSYSSSHQHNDNGGLLCSCYLSGTTLCAIIC